MSSSPGLTANPCGLMVDLPLNDDLSPEALRDAALVVCGAASGKEEAREVLWALGLVPDPEHKPSYCGAVAGQLARKRLQRGQGWTLTL